MDTEIDDTQKVTLSIMKTDGHGNAVAFVGIPSWSSTDVLVATVTPATDGLSAVVTSVASGTTDIQISGDSLSKTWNIVVSAPEILVQAMSPQPK